MRSDLVERRLELLKQSGMGVNLNLIVKNLAEKYGVSTRTIYADWQHRDRWIEAAIGLKDPETFFLELIANHKEIKHKAVLEYLRGDNSNARVGALRLIRDLNLDFIEMITVNDLRKRVDRLERS